MPQIDEPFTIPHLQSSPQMPGPRLWEPVNVHSRQPLSELGHFVVDESVGVLIWFRIKLQVENIGSGPALVDLSGEMRFIDASTDETLERTIQLPATVVAADQLRSLLQPGGRAVVEWYDCVEAKASMEGAPMRKVIMIRDHAGAVVQYIPIEAGAYPLEYVPGSSVMVRVAESPRFGASVYPHLTWYSHEGSPYPQLPWSI